MTQFNSYPSLNPPSLHLGRLVQLQNAEQSSNLNTGNCLGYLCNAEKAIDGDGSTVAITEKHSFDWWSVEMAKVANIDIILFSTGEYAYGAVGIFKRFAVATRMKASDPWEVCRKEGPMQRPILNHVVWCNDRTIARYIRFSTRGNTGLGQGLTLNQVKVLEIASGKEIRTM